MRHIKVADKHSLISDISRKLTSLGCRFLRGSIKVENFTESKKSFDLLGCLVAVAKYCPGFFRIPILQQACQIDCSVWSFEQLYSLQ